MFQIIYQHAFSQNKKYEIPIINKFYVRELNVITLKNQKY